MTDPGTQQGNRNTWIDPWPVILRSLGAEERVRAFGGRLSVWKEGLDFVSLVPLGLLGTKTLEGSQPGVHRRLINKGTPVPLQNLPT